jgi:hypothetical protein
MIQMLEMIHGKQAVIGSTPMLIVHKTKPFAVETNVSIKGDYKNGLIPHAILHEGI